MSRFVSGGTDDEPTERDDAWLKAQQEIEASHLRKIEEGRQEGGKTLYETLQANKAAKQEAFEESIRLKNQFRTLDEDEVEFLDSILESTRAKEAAVRKETSEQLDAFRKQREEAERAALAEVDSSSAPRDEEHWVSSGRKRKKGRDKEQLLGVKLRKSSSTSERPATATTILSTAVPTVGAAGSGITAADTQPAKPIKSESGESGTKAILKEDTLVAAEAPVKTLPKANIVPVLGLSGYSSDDDE